MPMPRKSPFSAGYSLIIDRLIARRKAMGMTQVILAELYGEDQSFVSRVERKQRRLDVFEYVRWCRTLRSAPADFLADLPEE